MKFDLEYLNEKIEGSSYSINDMYIKLDISRISFWKKRKGMRPFKIDEVLQLCDILNLEVNDVFIKN